VAWHNTCVVGRHDIDNVALAGNAGVAMVGIDAEGWSSPTIATCLLAGEQVGDYS
jgi:hypothetical protein